MDPKNAADFDDSMDQIARIRRMPSVIEKVDSVVLEAMPLVEEAAAAGLTFAAPAIPGGPAAVGLVELGAHILGPMLEDRIRKWLQAKAAAASAPPAPPSP